MASANNLGYSQNVSAFLSRIGLAASGLFTFPANDSRTGVAILLPALPDGQQIDAINARAQPENGMGIFRRIIVASYASLSGAVNFLNSGVPSGAGDVTLSQIFYSNAAGPGSGVLGGLIVADPAVIMVGAQIHLDWMDPIMGTDQGNFVGQSSGTVPHFSARPGAGLAIAPNRAGLVLLLAARAFDGPVAVANAPVGPTGSVSLSVFGGPLAPGQYQNVSAASASRADGKGIADARARAVPHGGGVVLP